MYKNTGSIKQDLAWIVEVDRQRKKPCSTEEFNTKWQKAIDDRAYKIEVDKILREWLKTQNNSLPINHNPKGPLISCPVCGHNHLQGWVCMEGRLKSEKRIVKPKPQAEKVTAPWGIFGMNGEWEPNPKIKMSFTSQYRENVKNGYLPASGRIRHMIKPKPPRYDDVYFDGVAWLKKQ